MQQITTSDQFTASGQDEEIPYFADRMIVQGIEDIEAFERVALEERGLPNSTYEMLGEAARVYRDRPAIKFFENGDTLEDHITLTHGDLFGKITQCANLFHGLGVDKTDVIAVLAPSVLETQYVLWGAQAAGVVFPLNWMLEPDILVKLLKKSKAKVLVAYGPDEEFEIWNKVMQIAPDLAGDLTIVKVGGGEVRDDAVVELMAGLADQSDETLLSGRAFDPKDMCTVFHTGGTTGTPKLVYHTHENEVFMTWISAQQYDFRSHDVRVCGVPLFHVNGALTNCLMPIARGATCIMATAAGWRHPSTIRNLWDIVSYFGVTVLPLVPSVMNMALNIPVGNKDISCLKVVVSGTAPLSVNVADAFAEMTGAKIIEGYGLTETTAVSAANPRHGPEKIGSIGLRKAYQPMKAVVLDANAKYVRDCKPGEPGAIVVKGPNVFGGYSDDVHNAKLWADDGWMNTGDIGYIDDDQYFWLTGRSKDLIIRGGHNIDPQMVEEFFFAHPAVQEAAAVSVPDAHAGELPVVFLALKPDTTVQSGRLKFYSYETIPERAAVPKKIYILDELPKTQVGKVQKNILRVEAGKRGVHALLKDEFPAHAFDVVIREGDDGKFVGDVKVDGMTAGELDAARNTLMECLEPIAIPCEFAAV